MSETKTLGPEALFLIGMLIGAILAGGGITVSELAAVSELACEPVEPPDSAPVRPDEPEPEPEPVS